MQHFHATTNEELRHFLTVPPPPSYDAAQASAAHTRGNAHVIAAATRRAAPGESTAEAPDLSPLPQSLNRPRLPEDKRNHILDSLPEDAAIVKFQTIVREEKEITVGRIKLPIPGAGNHAFVLRRYDTDAISLTTMYKVAFPGASEDDEKREMEWVRSSFDTRNTNGDRENGKVRLAGQWVSRHLAVHLAPAYNMKALVTTLARAVPDPTVEYRKSQRSQQAAEEMRLGQAANHSAEADGPDADDHRAKRTRRADSSEDGTAGDTQTFRLEAHRTVTGPAASTQSTMEAEIAQAKQMVIDLRRELALQTATGHVQEETGVAMPDVRRGVRRARGESSATAAIDGATTGVNGERVIRTNRTIERGGATRARAFAFNTFIFGLGVGAAAFLPQLAAQYF